jgi:hypothetical protein
MSEESGIAGTVQENSPDLASAKDVVELADVLSQLSAGDELEINRATPISERGYLTSLPVEDAGDLKETLKSAYGPGKYLIKGRRRTRDGKFNWIKGSATIYVAGTPWSQLPRDVRPGPMSASTAMVVPHPPQFGGDIQGKLLDVLVSKLQTPAEQLKDVVASIQDVITGGHNAVQTAQTDPLAGIVQAAKTYKELKAIFGREERTPNPADDDDDDEEEDLGTDAGLMSVLGKMFLKNMGPQQQQAPMAPGEGPPGWAKAPDGQWVQVPVDAPPGWTKMPNGEWVRLPHPPPVGGYHSQTQGGRPVYRDAQGDFVDAQGRRVDVRPADPGRTWPPKMRDREPTRETPQWKAHSRQEWPASTAQEKAEVNTFPPMARDYPAPFDEAIAAPREAPVETVTPQNDRIENPGEADSNGSESNEEDDDNGVTACIHCGSDDIEAVETTEGLHWRCFNCKGTFEDPVESVSLAEATPEAIADEIENMEEDEQLLTFELLAQKFGLPIDVVREFVKNSQQEKAGKA